MFLFEISSIFLFTVFPDLFFIFRMRSRDEKQRLIGNLEREEVVDTDYASDAQWQADLGFEYQRGSGGTQGYQGNTSSGGIQGSQGNTSIQDTAEYHGNGNGASPLICQGSPAASVGYQGSPTGTAGYQGNNSYQSERYENSCDLERQSPPEPYCDQESFTVETVSKIRLMVV